MPEQRPVVAVLLPGAAAAAPACPAWLNPAEFGRALSEDVADVVNGLAGVAAVVAAPPSRRQDAEAIRWPGIVIVGVPETPSAVWVLAMLANRGYRNGVVLAADVPDLPGLMLAKPLQAVLSRDRAAAPVAVMPADGGGLVALAARLPAPAWLAATGIELDAVDALAVLRAAAPDPAALAVTAGWHRLRAPQDLSLLDEDLEGWDATRALLARRRG